jgi:hypothetical protein
VIIAVLAALGEDQEPESVKSAAAMGGHSIALALEAASKKIQVPILSRIREDYGKHNL